MSDEQPPSRTPPRKRWVDRISQLFSGEPQDLDDLLGILREARKNRLLDTDALSMIEGILQVSQMRVRDIMIPRIQMVVVPKDAELETIFPLVTEFGHSRYPVIDGDRSKVVGILLAKDLLARALQNKTLTVQEIMRPAYIVPESKRLKVLLKELRTNGNHMAIVVDEYGQAAGLVTIEDVLEEIVGEIEDEHDTTDIIERKISDNEYIFSGRSEIDLLNEKYFINLPETEEFETLAGFILYYHESIPKINSVIKIGIFQFKILKATNTKIELVKLTISEE